jgi:hypothetical protein
MAKWIRSYERRWLRGDLIAGVAVAALIVPDNLGFAGVAGIPLQNGLYAAAAGAILYCTRSLGRAGGSRPGPVRDCRLWPGSQGVQDAASFGEP